ncbi:hypothetical protein CEUSTIGMA_g11218.t1 [Chlamydomonas eustigma]|uniref:Uncharacterized protein n=1 Tax=Chlamydomonas eustigma TaxID=1157962 RepID=A0A250XL92_9CHLO|nr:hypothetical protein CEUSTIGMA_g11218.t1 [Chlamydomonas eustigma]|eukprot:GAX83793.1 hypothetical protein CEUSTIGMA_g11218.t1 [Chlamydomonas eustigma]
MAMSSIYTLPAAALAFCTWAVYMGSLASMQHICSSMSDNDVATYGFAGGLVPIFGFTVYNQDCKVVYGYWWFVMSYEFVIVLAVGAAATLSTFRKFKNSFIGLFAVATVLYIQAAYAFYNASALTYYNNGTPFQTIRTIVAGSIMTAVANGFLMIVLGIEDDVTADHHHAPVVTATKDAAEPAQAV